MSITTIAFIGLGGMGSPMAQNLQSQVAFSVVAWNRTQQDRPLVKLAQEHGVQVAPTIQAAVATADIICICVSDVQDVDRVIFGEGGIVHYAQPESIVIDFSTIGPQAARLIAQKLQPYNLHFLDAPVSGGDIGAQQATLTIMVGGDKADFDRALPIFNAIGKKIVHCGAIGSGQAIKLCNQVLCGIHMVALTEAMLLAQQLEVDPRLAIDICSSGAGGSWALSNLAPKAVTGDFQPGFMVKHILKDLRLVDENLQELDLPGVTLANQMFKSVRDLGGADQGTQAMIRAYQQHKN
jgi:3-hydroxyisobutyrate dehydrogenase